MLQCNGVGSLHSCTISKSSWVYFYLLKPADNLFCTAALDSGDRLLPRTVLRCNGVGSLPMHCSTDSGKMHAPQLKAALQNRHAVALCHCDCTHEGLLFIQVCSDPPPMHCNTDCGKMYSPLLSVALKKRHTAALCHCNYTYEGLLFIQVCSDPPSMHCNTDCGKMYSPLLSAARHAMPRC